MSGALPMKFEKSPATVMNDSELLFQDFRQGEGYFRCCSVTH
jgi:hypothetical protein